MSDTENDLLNERLAQRPDDALDIQGRRVNDVEPRSIAETPNSPAITFQLSQWSAEFNDTFRPAGPSRDRLPAGVYRFDQDQRGLYLQRIRVITDNLIDLDDSASQRVLAGIRVFWRSKKEYVKRGIIYKRGVLLWGPAGSGKTATLAMLTHDLIAADGLVVICENPAFASSGLDALRRIEPERPLIVVMEDIDEMIRKFGEHELLALLDGENQINNVVNIATTNYPELLGARIVNRPSRFDERILIDMPGTTARRKYLSVVTSDERMPDEMLAQWVSDTEGFSVAHMRELVVAVFCLKQPYEDVLDRLKKMRVQPRPMEEFKRREAGLLGIQKQHTDAQEAGHSIRRHP